MPTVWRTVLFIHALAGCGLAAAPGQAGDGLHSVYTRHDYQACRVRPSAEPDVIEERQCPGYGGVPVLWTGEPDASSVRFGQGPDREDLDPGTSFYEVDPVIEWRGPRSRTAIRPPVAIVRYWTGPSVGRLNRSVLVVNRLVPGQASCVMAMVTGGDANARARRIVDRQAAAFVCGASEPIEDHVRKR